MSAISDRVNGGYLSSNIQLPAASSVRRRRRIPAIDISACPSFALLRDRIEDLSVSVQHGVLPRVFLKPAHDTVRVFRIDFHEPCPAPAALTGDERRAGASKKIRDDVSRLAAIQECAF